MDNITCLKYFQQAYNVTSYELILPCDYTIVTNKNELKKDCQVYIIFDTFYNLAFGHWVFESGIYLPFLSYIKNVYPNTKIILKNTRSYKNMFLNYFGLTDKNIVYTIETTNNLCFFPTPKTCSLNTCQNLQVYNVLVSNFMNTFDNIQTDKIYKLAILPRHKTENFYLFDRIIDTSDIERVLSLSPENLVFDTFGLSSLVEHMTPIKQSKIIIIHDGSSFLVNSMFAQNSRIIVLGCQTCFQAINCDNVKMIAIINHIAQHNEIVYVGINIAFTSRKEIYLYSDIEKFIHVRDLHEICHCISNNIYVTKNVKEHHDYTISNLRECWNKTCY